MKTNDIIKLRTRKLYSDAANHILVGRVIEYNKVFLELECKAFHYKSFMVDTDRMIESTEETRIVPWSNVECINILNEGFNWKEAQIVQGLDGVYLDDHGEKPALLCRTRVTH